MSEIPTSLTGHEMSTLTALAGDDSALTGDRAAAAHAHARLTYLESLFVPLTDARAQEWAQWVRAIACRTSGLLNDICPECGLTFGDHNRFFLAGKLADALAASLQETTREVNKCNKLTHERDTLQAENAQLREQAANACACSHNGRGELATECQEHREQREALVEIAAHRDEMKSSTP